MKVKYILRRLGVGLLASLAIAIAASVFVGCVCMLTWLCITHPFIFITLVALGFCWVMGTLYED